MSNLLPWFLLTFTTLWLLGALVTNIRREAISVSLSLALLASLFTAGLGAATWLENLHWETVEIQFDCWQGLDVSVLPSLRLEFGLDALSGFFVFLVSGFSALVAIYSFRALQASHFRPYAHWIASAFNLFSWTTILVLVAQDGFSLLISLELMTLSFGYLVLYKHFLHLDRPEEVSDENALRKAQMAPQIYLMSSHSSTAFLVLAVLLLSICAGGLSYRSWLAQVSSLSTPIMSAVFLLALIGLGIRAGLTPAHVWVPLVHPSSPTPTHALSLGIAIKVAIYLMYRFFFQFLSPEAWWGYMLLAIAAASAVTNVWYAISSHDLKEALAYHSIENIGIICAGVGLSLIFWQSNRQLAYLGLVASLYHLLNHAVFKGLLYLATGAIDNLTHIVDIEHLGGLIHRYHFTASMFLIGSFSIAGFPPFNGFISEWLTLRTGLSGLLALADSAFIPFFMVLVSLLMLVASFALTVFCFYKMAGVALLGLPRLPEEKRSQWAQKDVPFTMKGVMALMAAFCLLLGILPGIVAPQIAKAFTPLGMPDNLPPANWTRLDLLDNALTAESMIGADQLPIGTLLVVMVALIASALILYRSFPAKARHPTFPWNCGEPLMDVPTHQYTSGALSYSLRKLFAPANSKPSSVPDYFPSHFVLSKSPNNPQLVIEAVCLAYNHLIHAFLTFSRHFGTRVQNRDIRRYLQYVFWVNLLILFLYWLTSKLLG